MQSRKPLQTQGEKEIHKSKKNNNTFDDFRRGSKEGINTGMGTKVTQKIHMYVIH